MKFNFLAFAATALLSAASFAEGSPLFSRISTFSICEQIDADCNTDTATNAETIWSYTTPSGETNLVYTDSESENIGIVDITDPTMPKPAGVVPLSGEPTTVRVVANQFAVVGVNTSPDYVNPTGNLSVIDLATKQVVLEIPLPGQPDAVDVSKDGSSPVYIAVAIENERDEDLGDGAPPQLPAGLLTLITITGADPSTWVTNNIELTGYQECRFPEDPEPEYVAISADNTQAIVTLQENNCNILVDLATATVTAAYDAGSVQLTGIDTIEEKALILQEEDEEPPILREADGVTWIGDTNYYATANEGDLDGGSRGWSIFDAATGDVVYDSASEMEWMTAMAGHYPDNRSGNKGNEPENVFYSAFPDFGTEYVFVLSERSSVVFVYSIDSSVSPPAPEFVQMLAVSIGPEGITTIPSQNLVAIASEVDERGDKLRSSIAIFELGESDTGIPEYPTLVSAPRDGESGAPIPFAALSGLAAGEDGLLYTVEDSFFKKSRIMTIDTSTTPPTIVAEHRILDSEGVLADCLTGQEGVDLAARINDDSTINIDLEGISISSNGGFWVVSEGRGTFGDEGRPIEYPNILLEVDSEANIIQCILPDDSFQPQLRFGFEGVAEDGSKIAVAVQRAWGEDSDPRIAVYDTEAGAWTYAFYPLDEAVSQNGGWVGLSDISSLGDGKFLVIERDNQGGPDAALKKIYQIDLGDYSWEAGTVLEKTLVMDLIEDGVLTATNGQIIEKVEGLAVTADGDVWINTDNDGVDDSSGESLLAMVATVETYKSGAFTKGLFLTAVSCVSLAALVGF